MPGLIVSRPIFNTLFKLAHEEGISINAFLTKLLENAGPDGLKQAVSGKPLVAVGAASSEASTPASEIAGSEQDSVVRPAATSVATAPQPRHELRPIAYDEEEPEPAGVGASPDNAEHQFGNSTWDRVVSMEGRRFATSRGKKFSYKVTGEYIVVRDSQARIPKSQFDKAQKMWPVSGPSRLVGVYAPSVVWAIMKELNEAEEAAAV